MFFVEDAQCWRKFTKWNQSGYTVERVNEDLVFLPARPSQYLKRLLLQNEVFGDQIEFVGVQASGYHLRIVTEQPHIVGRAPDWEEMERLLAAQHGLRRLRVPPMGHYRSFSFLRGALGCFDVHPANCVVAEEGTIVPIDFVMVNFGEAEACGLADLVEYGS